LRVLKIGTPEGAVLFNEATELRQRFPELEEVALEWVERRKKGIHVYG